MFSRQFCKASEKRSGFGRILAVLMLFAFVFSADCHNAGTAAARSVPTEVITVFGASRIHTDITSAKNAAVSDCLVSAVQIAATRILPGPTLSENFESVSTLLSRRSREFILDYKVLREIKAASDYRVLVQATVSMEKLSAELAAAGIIMAAEDLPRVLFAVAEQNTDDLAYQYWWRSRKTLYTPESASGPMIESFMDRGFTVVDHRAIPMEYLDNLGIDGPLLSDAEAAGLGAQFQAGIVVAGTGAVKEIPNRLGETIRTFSATVAIRAIQTDTGQTLANVQVSSAATHSDPDTGGRMALSEAGQQAGLQMATRIQSQWKSIAGPEMEITITLEGVNLLSNLVTFRRALAEIPGVIRHQSVEMTSRRVILSAIYAGTSRGLADAVLVRPFDEFGIHIEELSRNHLQIVLIPKAN
jgi:hypothetical protein